MIQVADKLWIGDSAAHRTMGGVGITAVLNVASDLPARHWFDPVWDAGGIDIGTQCPPKAEHAHVGLVNGPGNEPTDYAAAVLCLKGLMRRHDGGVLIYDHDGGVALVVAAMYLNLLVGQVRPNHMSWSHWSTWLERIAVIREYTGGNSDLPVPHDAHIKAFDRMPWGVLEVL